MYRPVRVKTAFVAWTSFGIYALLAVDRRRARAEAERALVVNESADCPSSELLGDARTMCRGATLRRDVVVVDADERSD